MLKDTLSHAQLSIFTEIATLLLVAIFAGAFLYLFVWRAKGSWKQVSELPLHDDVPVQLPSSDGGSSRSEPAERSPR